MFACTVFSHAAAVQEPYFVHGYVGDRVAAVHTCARVTWARGVLRVVPTGECILFNTWPVTPPAPPPPPTPPHWPNTSQPMHAPAPAATYFHSDDVASTVAGMRQLAAAFVRSAPGLYELQNNERAHDASGSEHTGFYETVQALVGALLGRQSATASPAVGGEFPDPCGWNITCLIHRVFDQHLPFIDEDGDDFSPPGAYDATFRGGDWRGRDCNDSDASM